MIDAVIEELKTHQTQLDQDGVMVGVSRQALEELLAHVAAPAQPAPIAGLEPVAWQLRYSDSNDPWVIAEKVNTTSLIEWRGLVPVEQAQAHAAEQVRAEREAIAEQLQGWDDFIDTEAAQSMSVASAAYANGGSLADDLRSAILAMQAERRGDNTIQRDKIYRAAERSNTRFGQWIPERWVNIFVEEMSK